jgi:hypothetical protein
VGYNITMFLQILVLRSGSTAGNVFANISFEERVNCRSNNAIMINDKNNNNNIINNNNSNNSSRSSSSKKKKNNKNKRDNWREDNEWLREESGAARAGRGRSSAISQSPTTKSHESYGPIYELSVHIFTTIHICIYGRGRSSAISQSPTTESH